MIFTARLLTISMISRARIVLHFDRFVCLLHKVLDLIKFLVDLFYETLFFVNRFFAVAHVYFDSVKDQFASQTALLAL